MARYRTIKPEFWTSGQVVECSTNARLMFVGLWNFCDDAGIHPASTKRVKMELFPGDDFTQEQIQGWVDELLAVDLLRQYEVDGQSFWIVTGWHHQKIESPSYRHPKPPGFAERSTNGRRTVGERSATEGNGREDGKERSSLDVDVNTGADPDALLDFDWDSIREDCRKVTKSVPSKSKQDASLIVKAVVLSRTRFSANWLWDSVEATRLRDTQNKPKYFHGVLRSKCQDVGLNLNHLLKQIQIPDSYFHQKVPP